MGIIEDYLKFKNRVAIVQNSEEYALELDKIAKNFDGIVKNHTDGSKRVFCKKCDTIMSAIGFGGYPVKCVCKCEEEQIHAENERIKMQEKLQKMRKLKKLSLIGEKYKNTTFESTETGTNSSFDKAFNRCLKYSENYRKILKKGYGIYLWGDKGVGKTHITACISNFLISQCVPVLFTNLFEISKALRATFRKDSTKTEQDLIEKFSNIEFLVFDDLGTEKFTKNDDDTWIQGLLFDIVNKRYNNLKPTIFSSNYSQNELVNERKIMAKTIDRIVEMTTGAVMKITGKSNRQAKINHEKLEF